MKLQVDSKVVSWHGHLDAIWKGNIDSAVSSSDEALWAVSGEERLRSTTLIWLENVDFSLAASADCHGVWLGEAHTTLNLVSSKTSEEHSNIVSSLGNIHLLVESLNSSDISDLVLSVDTDQMHFFIELDLALLDSSSGDTTSSWNVDTAIN